MASGHKKCCHLLQFHSCTVKISVKYLLFLRKAFYIQLFLLLNNF